MEYVECGNLSSFIAEKGEMSENVAKSVTSQLLEGLKIMHANNFCHRDLKPEVGLHKLEFAGLIKLTESAERSYCYKGTFGRQNRGFRYF